VRTPRSASGLTAREYSLLAELVRGEGGALNKDIAFRLGIGEPTIKVYYSLLMRKLGLSNRTALALWAERSGQFCEASA
jgi:DNA-binding NarL/FixJ family response regulator